MYCYTRNVYIYIRLIYAYHMQEADVNHVFSLLFFIVFSLSPPSLSLSLSLSLPLSVSIYLSISFSRHCWIGRSIFPTLSHLWTVNCKIIRRLLICELGVSGFIKLHLLFGLIDYIWATWLIACLKNKLAANALSFLSFVCLCLGLCHRLGHPPPSLSMPSWDAIPSRRCQWNMSPL